MVEDDKKEERQRTVGISISDSADVRMTNIKLRGFDDNLLVKRTANVLMDKVEAEAASPP